jgi:nitroreductase
MTVGSGDSTSGILADHAAAALREALAGRRSVRSYAPEPLDDDMIRALIETAVLAPSATNAQPWLFTVVRDQALLERLSTESKAHLLANLPPTLQTERYRARLSDPSFHIFHHAPALILISAVAARPWASEDCALAAGYLMLGAYGRGLGTCWIGFAQRYLNTDEGKRLLGLPAECVPVAPIVVGRPVAWPKPTARREPEVGWVG